VLAISPHVFVTAAHAIIAGAVFRKSRRAILRITREDIAPACERQRSSNASDRALAR
jgi:hypothetical protein